MNVAGVGVLAATDRDDDALRFAEYLLGESAQTFFAEVTREYPLVAGIPLAEGLPALDSLQSPDIDLSDLDTLEETLQMIEESGLT